MKKYTKISTVFLIIAFVFSFSAIQAARVDLVQSGSVYNMTINPENMPLSTILVNCPGWATYPITNTEIGMAFYDLPSPVWICYEQSAANVYQNSPSTTITLDGSGVNSSGTAVSFTIVGNSAKVNAYVLINGTRYFINTANVQFYLNGLPMVKSGEDYIFSTTGVTPTPSPTPIITPTPTAVPNKASITVSYSGTTLSAYIDKDSANPQNLFMEKINTWADVKSIGIRYFYEGGSSWTEDEWFGFSQGSGLPASVNFTKARDGYIRFNIIAKNQADEVCYANVFYWQCTFKGLTVNPSNGAWDITFQNEWNFSWGSRGWTPVAQIGCTSGINLSVNQDGLCLSPDGSANGFGYWLSPVLSLDPGNYKAQFTVGTNAAVDKAPQFRLRINTTDNWSAWDRVVNSYANTAPASGVNKIYEVRFSITEEAPTIICVDLLSFDQINDDVGATIFVSEVKMIKE